MSTLVELRGSKAIWEPPPVKSLDEAVWQAWVQKGVHRPIHRVARFGECEVGTQ